MIFDFEKSLEKFNQVSDTLLEAVDQKRGREKKRRNCLYDF